MVYAFDLWLCYEEKNMKILLIRPKPHADTIGLQSVMICEPLELMTLAAVLKHNGHEVTLVDMIIEKKPLSYFVKTVAPEVVGITGYISHINCIKGYARSIKQLNSSIKVAVGGVHAMVCPDDFSDDAIDIICHSAIDFYQYCDCSDCTPQLPYRELPKKYTQAYYYLFQNKCALIKTSFGCPYQCTFCFCKEITPYATRTIDDVISELLTIQQEEVYIVDDDFLFNRQRLMEFVEKVEAHNIRKHYLVYGRADFIAENETTLKRLADIGLTAVIVGIEAASQDELDKYNKRTSLDQNERAIEILQKLGIECYATVILGIDWDKSNFQRLYQFIKKNHLVFVNLQPFTPMPGTGQLELYRDQLIIPYQEHEKWDMAHLVVKPTKVSVRRYYLYILSLYYKITVTPKNIAYMFKRYGVMTTLKLSLGAMKITYQYLKKVWKGV